MTQSPDTQPRTILITGASQGIGLAYAQAFADAGHHVVMADIRGAEQAAESLNSGSVIGVTGDVTKPADAQAIVQAALDRFGRLDVLVNNAAFYAGLNLANFEQITEADWDRSMNVNVKGVWLMCRAAAPPMRTQGWGRIINIASNVVFMGKPNFLHYVTSKGAVWALT
ncbi:MAG: SDR family NAD(P)-dependent oxidoreductase, partial [Actinomycetales bacterium]